ncbi:glycosyltransferase [Vibrio rotiferianus]|uniref:glycosyltransferase n=1 Tax=Vibrio rotiferianus TaxID=190895 RepID=UPI003908DE14
MERKKIAFVVATPMTINSFMKQHICQLSKHYSITVIANFNLCALDTDLPVKVIHIPISRRIDIVKDIKALYFLIKVLKSENFDSIHSITPKAGLFSMVAGSLAKCRILFHTYTGQVWANKKGFKRLFLKLLDKITFHLADFVLVDSISQREFLINEKVITSDKSKVLGSGSISGVNINKFSPNLKSDVRDEYSIPNGATLFLYLGRVCYDKGIKELVESFRILSSIKPDVYLLIVGPSEGDFDMAYFTRLGLERLIRIEGYQDAQPFFSASNILLLPSYREGFGSTVLEAAACCVPTIGSDIYGLNDAIVNGVTGLLHEKGDSRDLFKKMLILAENPEYTHSLGKNAMIRAHLEFSSEVLTSLLIKFYRSYHDV